MSEQDTTDDTLDKPSAEPEATATVRRGGLAVGVVILLSLGWYLLADRFTPYTDQARLQGYVIGVAPKVAGVVTRVRVANNEEVEAGQPLFEIDASQYEIALQKARSDLENAQRQVAAGSAVVESARANLRAAEANRVKAEKDLSRLQRLYREDPGTISQRRLEISQASLDQARAAVTAAEADIQRAIEQKGGDDDQENTVLKAAQSAVDKGELDLANTTVRASSDGVITDLRADVGQFAGTGSPVMTLIAVHDMWISAEFTENNLGHLRPGSPVDIAFDALPGRVIPGTVRSIGLGISTAQAPPPGTLPTIQNSRDWLRQAQRFPVIIDFEPPQEDDLRRQLRVGGQAAVVAYSDGHGILALLGRAYIRLMSWLSYAY
jgi:multidrug resistance efflux pump